MFRFLKNNPLAAEARTARLRPTVGKQLLIFLGVMLVGEIVASIPSSIYAVLCTLSLIDPEALAGMLTDQNDELLTEEMNAISAALMRDDGYILCMLFSMVGVILITVLYCRFVEKRSLSSMGLGVRAGAPRSLALGFLFGLLMFGAAFLISYAMGAITVGQGSPAPGIMVLYFFAFFVQAASEEILFRGYLMLSLCNATTPGRAVFISALMFSLMHGGNAGYTILGAVNIFVFGLLLGLLVFRAQSLWMAIALHAMWNFAEGNIFGASVSGMMPSTSILVSLPVDGRNLTSGGVFGPEAGLAVSMVLLLALVALWYFPSKENPAPTDESIGSDIPTDPQ